MIQRYFIKQFLVRWLITLMVLPGIVQAQAVPASLMQRAVAGITQKKMSARGFASNDPRWGATLQANGSAIAGGAAAAAAITAAGITAPAWVTAGAVIALGALFTAGINLAIDGIKWLFNADGSVKYTGTVPGQSQKGGQTFSGVTTTTGNVVSGGTAIAVAAQWAADFQSQTHTTPPIIFYVEGCVDWASGTTTSCTIGYSQAGYPDTHNWRTVQMTRNQSLPYTCDGLTINGTCNPPVSGGSGDVTKSPTDAVAALSDADKAKPVNPQVLAAIADQAWQRAAAAPGYQGYPYDATNPITAADASAYQAANPQAWPSVGDLVAPRPNVAGQPSPFALPNSAADPAPSTGTDKPPAETGTTFDWSIPNTGEAIGKQAVAVSYVPTVFAAPTGCPAPVTFAMFGKQYAIAYSPFCGLMTTLAPIFLACGAAAAALIFAESLKS